MSMTPAGKHVCDRCGRDVGNGSVMNCAVVSDLDPDEPGHVRNLHFCHDYEDEGKTVKGCSRKILSPSNLKHYEEMRDAQ